MCNYRYPSDWIWSLNLIHAHTSCKHRCRSPVVFQTYCCHNRPFYPNCVSSLGAKPWNANVNWHIAGNGMLIDTTLADHGQSFDTLPGTSSISFMVQRYYVPILSTMAQHIKISFTVVPKTIEHRIPAKWQITLPSGITLWWFPKIEVPPNHPF